jgi:hypothetical protein
MVGARRQSQSYQNLRDRGQGKSYPLVNTLSKDVLPHAPSPLETYGKEPDVSVKKPPLLALEN